MNKRLQQLIDKGAIPNKGGVFIDSYNQSVNEDVAGTITTRIDASNMSYVTEPKIIEVRAIGRERTEEEKKRRHLHGDKGAKFSGGKQMCFLSEISGCLTTSPTKDNLVGEIYDVNCNKENKMNNDTLTSVQKDNLVVEPKPYDENYTHVRELDSKEEADAYMGSLRIPQATKQGYIEVPPGSVFDASYPDSKTRRGRVQECGQVSPTLMAGGEAPCRYEGKDATSYRIRKLTPRECFRLMGVSETNIDKIQQSGVSQSQQYKMAGNSIVVDVLYHLMRKMFIEKQNESQQLTLF